MDPRPSIDPAIALLTDDGTPVTLGQFIGKPSLFYFGFTNCRVVCPRSLQKLTTVITLLDNDGYDVIPLYVTVDPDRDTPAVMKAYLESNFPRFTGLTGEVEQIEKAKRAFRVFAESRPAPDEPDGYVVPHTAISYLMDSEGRYLGHFGDNADAEAIYQRARRLLPPPTGSATKQ